MYDHDHDNEIVPFAQTNFRNAKVRFGIKTDDRRRHMYVVGKTGMGKTNLLRTLILRDIEAGHGVGLVDPHGDFAEEILEFIPANRINDVVYFNPADLEYPMGFNVLEAVDERYKHLVAAGMMGVFKKIWPDVWSPRMEYIMNSCLLALLDYPGSTMLGINRLLVDKEYRRLVISKVKDPVVKSFWVNEYASYADKFRTEAIAPIQNKVGQFLSTAVIRNIVAQVKSSINPRDIMDTGKIFIMNLSKGRIGEDASRLLGGLLITKLQLAAMERVDMPEKERRDFYLYVDEFQNFATESFANILSEARKYRLNLLVAHQYIEQLDEKVAAAVFGNVGTMICFRVGGADSLILEKEFEPHFMGTDLVNLAKWDVYLKLMIDGVASTPFSASTLPPEHKTTGNAEKVIKVSRERYAEKRDVIEEKINRWSGFGEEGEGDAQKGEDRKPGLFMPGVESGGGGFARRPPGGQGGAPQPFSRDEPQGRRFAPPSAERESLHREEPAPAPRRFVEPRPAQQPPATFRRDGELPRDRGVERGLPDRARPSAEREVTDWASAHRHPQPFRSGAPVARPPIQRTDAEGRMQPSSSLPPQGKPFARKEESFSSEHDQGRAPLRREPQKVVPPREPPRSMPQRGEIVEKEIAANPMSLSELAAKAKTEAREKRVHHDERPKLTAAKAEEKNEPQAAQPSHTPPTDVAKGRDSGATIQADPKYLAKRKGSLKPGQVIKLDHET